MLAINIPGGTHAGWRKLGIQKRNDWVCPVCGKTQRYYWISCPNDGAPRPSEEV